MEFGWKPTPHCPLRDAAPDPFGRHVILVRPARFRLENRCGGEPPGRARRIRSPSAREGWNK